MDRRKFLIEAALWSAGAAAAPAFTLSREALAGSGPATVAVARGTDWGKLVAQALAPLGGIGAFVKKGKRVLVKPNIAFDRTPEQGANTHPEIVKSVVQQCLDAGAALVTVFDRTLAEERRCYINSGIAPTLETIKDSRLRVIYTDDSQYIPLKINGMSLKNWSFNKNLLESDIYINIPVAKHHGSAKLSLGLKNVLGVAGGNRGRIHWNLDQGIADLNTVARPTLTIIDATRILLRNGPSGGDLKDGAVKNTVIASTDTVAADSFAAATLFSADPAQIGYIKAANQLGLGEMDINKIKVLHA